MLYSTEEFEAQMADLIAKGINDAVAYDIVRLREQDAHEGCEFYNGICPKGIGAPSNWMES